MGSSKFFSRRTILLALLATLLLSVGLFQIKPIQAQTVPTATPSDPLWIAFSKVRDALESKFHTDLTIVSNWTYSETPFDGGIDDCVIVVGVVFDTIAHDEQIGIRRAIGGTDPDAHLGRQDDARPTLQRAAHERGDAADQPAVGDRAA